MILRHNYTRNGAYISALTTTNISFFSLNVFYLYNTQKVFIRKEHKNQINGAKPKKSGLPKKVDSTTTVFRFNPNPHGEGI